MEIHVCHAIGCFVAVKPELLMCARHWRKVPPQIQARVWKHYRKGQCDDKAPSREWCNAAADAILAVATKEGRAKVGQLGLFTEHFATKQGEST